MLIAAIVDLDTRSTMDLDATLRNLLFTEDKVIEVVKSICTIELKDDVTFEVVAIAPIRANDRCGGYCSTVLATRSPACNPRYSQHKPFDL
jgi:hypothetical protein